MATGLPRSNRDGALTLIVSKISPSLASALIVVLLCILIVLIGSAFVTHRDIEIWPPHIGPDKQILKELADIRNSVDSLRTNEQAIREKLISNLTKAREQSLSAKQFMLLGQDDARRIETEVSVSVDEENQKFLSGVETISNKLQKISDKLD